MLTPLENRGILLMADFEKGNWLWQYCGSQPPVPFWDGQLIRYGLLLSLQKDFYTWFAAGYKNHRGGTLDGIQFPKLGRNWQTSLLQRPKVASRFSLVLCQGGGKWEAVTSKKSQTRLSRS